VYSAVAPEFPLNKIEAAKWGGLIAFRTYLININSQSSYGLAARLTAKSNRTNDSVVHRYIRDLNTRRIDCCNSGHTAHDDDDTDAW